MEELKSFINQCIVNAESTGEYQAFANQAFGAVLYYLTLHGDNQEINDYWESVRVKLRW